MMLYPLVTTLLIGPGAPPSEVRATTAHPVKAALRIMGNCCPNRSSSKPPNSNTVIKSSFVYGSPDFPDSEFNSLIQNTIDGAGGYRHSVHLGTALVRLGTACAQVFEKKNVDVDWEEVNVQEATAVEEDTDIKETSDSDGEPKAKFSPFWDQAFDYRQAHFAEFIKSQIRKNNSKKKFDISRNKLAWAAAEEHAYRKSSKLSGAILDHATDEDRVIDFDANLEYFELATGGGRLGAGESRQTGNLFFRSGQKNQQILERDEHFTSPVEEGGKGRKYGPRELLKRILEEAERTGGGSLVNRMTKFKGIVEKVLNEEGLEPEGRAEQKELMRGLKELELSEATEFLRLENDYEKELWVSKDTVYGDRDVESIRSLNLVNVKGPNSSTVTDLKFDNSLSSLTFGDLILSWWRPLTDQLVHRLIKYVEDLRRLVDCWEEKFGKPGQPQPLGIRCPEQLTPLLQTTNLVIAHYEGLIARLLVLRLIFESHLRAGFAKLNEESRIAESLAMLAPDMTAEEEALERYAASSSTDLEIFSSILNEYSPWKESLINERGQGKQYLPLSFRGQTRLQLSEKQVDVGDINSAPGSGKLDNVSSETNEKWGIRGVVEMWRKHVGKNVRIPAGIDTENLGKGLMDSYGPFLAGYNAYLGTDTYEFVASSESSELTAIPLKQLLEVQEKAEATVQQLIRTRFYSKNKDVMLDIFSTLLPGDDNDPEELVQVEEQVKEKFGTDLPVSAYKHCMRLGSALIRFGGVCAESFALAPFKDFSLVKVQETDTDRATKLDPFTAFDTKSANNIMNFYHYKQALEWVRTGPANSDAKKFNDPNLALLVLDAYTTLTFGDLARNWWFPLVDYLLVVVRRYKSQLTEQVTDWENWKQGGYESFFLSKRGKRMLRWAEDPIPLKVLRERAGEIQTQEVRQAVLVTLVAISENSESDPDDSELDNDTVLVSQNEFKEKLEKTIIFEGISSNSEKDPRRHGDSDSEAVKRSCNAILESLFRGDIDKPLETGKQLLDLLEGLQTRLLVLRLILESHLKKSYKEYKDWERDSNSNGIITYGLNRERALTIFDVAASATFDKKNNSKTVPLTPGARVDSDLASLTGSGSVTIRIQDPDYGNEASFTLLDIARMWSLHVGSNVLIPAPVNCESKLVDPFLSLPENDRLALGDKTFEQFKQSYQEFSEKSSQDISFQMQLLGRGGALSKEESNLSKFKDGDWFKTTTTKIPVRREIQKVDLTVEHATTSSATMTNLAESELEMGLNTVTARGGKLNDEPRLETRPVAGTALNQNGNTNVVGSESDSPVVWARPETVVGLIILLILLLLLCGATGRYFYWSKPEIWEKNSNQGGDRLATVKATATVSSDESDEGDSEGSLV